ncbi:ImmA/IrrE family metallo-endopeptidase [Metabacillus niabensis]|uniref:Zn-dependent peptidase ImmA (M78 family) n=1 Tax=Metabacillus niabensis TaxID=324854 RepID=A0ABT9ZA11_9BACI|nr:ImmA/IrrE family metallo-endopeptidase [Metabacillus niabensis]MDQ0228453.1 Zn-dependent peptidase ImmA (M78 family) [Metabacillus niabensis]
MEYRMTQLEENIKEIYSGLGISSPYEIDPYHIANEYNVWIYFHKDESEVFKRTNGLYSLYLDERLSPQEQWQDFGHEFGHVVKHVGNQSRLHKPFRKLQENQANNFMFHFCVPTFMLLNYEISNYLNIKDGIKFISETFKVTEKFAKKRLIHFQNQISQSVSDHYFKTQMRMLYPKSDPNNWSDETKSLLDKLNRQVEKKKQFQGV